MADGISYAKEMLFMSSHNLRNLAVKNYKLLYDCITEPKTVEIRETIQLAIPQLLLNNRLHFIGDNNLLSELL